jgi:hypothetical protein
MFPNHHRPKRAPRLPEVAEPIAPPECSNPDDCALTDTEAFRVMLKRNLPFEPVPADLLARIHDRLAAIRVED